MKVRGFSLLKPAPDKCQECAVDHLPEQPHNRDSLYYQFVFFLKHGRHPTWADAIAHCTADLQRAWKEELKLRGAWTEKEEE